MNKLRRSKDWVAVTEFSRGVLSRVHRVVRFVRMKFPPRPLPPPPTPRQFINPTDDRVRRPTPRYIYIYMYIKGGEVLVVSIILLIVVVVVARIHANRGHELPIFRNGSTIDRLYPRNRYIVFSTPFRITRFGWR